MKREQRQEYIALIKSFPERLEELLKSLTVKQLDTPYGKGKWTPRQVVHHLADSHINALARLKWALTENNPELKPYDQEKWAELPDYTMPVDASLAILKGLHQRFTVLFENMTESDWKRPVRHPDPEYSSVENILKLYAGHCDKHLGHIKKVLK